MAMTRKWSLFRFMAAFTMVWCNFPVIMETDALVVLKSRGRVGGRALRMAAKGFGRPSTSPEPKTSSSRSSNARGFGGKRTANEKSAATAARVVTSTKQAPPGATVQREVMRQTEQSIRQSMDELKTTRPFVWEALELRKKLAQWQAETANLNVLQLSELPPGQVQKMKAAQALLRTLQAEHGISDRLLHNIAQEATWDASARVKDERQAKVQLPPSAIEHMEAVVERSEVGDGSRVMDVGAGTGILLRFLEGAGVKQENVVGVDLSSAMVDVASKRYPRATFVQADFLDYCKDQETSGSQEFSHVFFNGCLHNFLEPGEALAGAALLLEKGGKIVISHPKGAANVDMQRRSNPMLVPNRLPTAADLEKACERIPLLKAAGVHVLNGVQRVGGGYLQIMLKKP